MSLKISNLEQYKNDCKRYQSKIDSMPAGDEKLKLQSLLRDYKNIVHKIDTNFENIIFDDIVKSLDRQRSDSERMKEIRRQLESAV